MDRSIVIILIIAVLALLVSIMAVGEGTIHAASVKGQKKCVGVNAALNFIREKGCVRTYNDEKCEEQGKIEISC